jgi:AcrR family transcriptional regulator
MASSLVAVPGRRQLQKQDRERRILAAARSLFDRNGYAKTSMEDVAERAGLAVGTLYNYFRSKDDLLLAIMRREADRLLRIAEGIVADPPDDAVVAIAAMADLFVESISADERMLWRELFAASIGSPQDLGARLLELDMQIVAQLSALLEKMKIQGSIAAYLDPSETAMTIYGLCIAWALAFVTNETITVDAMRTGIAGAIRMMVRGLLPRLEA